MSARVSWKRAAARMGAVTALSRGIGLVRVLVVAAVLGTTYLGNAFQAANSVSNVLFELVAAGALSAVLVPSFVQLLDRGDDREADRLASGLLGVALAGLGALTVIGVVAAPLIARVLTAGIENDAVAADQRELETFLLRWFLPQILLYACATIATAVLYARRRFSIAAAAPIANSVVVIAAFIAFRAVAGSEPTFDLTTGEQMLLVIAGTGGVIAFAAVLIIAARRAGFSLRPRWMPRDPEIGRVLRLSGWGVLLHANAGMLLGAALIVGSSIAGGVVAYQVAFVFFLAPYSIFALPISTAILPELTDDVSRGDLDSFAATVRHALDRMAVIVLPISAVMVALALPGMRVVAFGRADGAGVELLAAALASLAVGLFPYGAFLLLARAYYALGDSRRPALVAIVSGIVGVVVMVVAALLTDGAARVAALGLGHTVSYLVGAVILGLDVRRRVAGHIWDADLGRAVLVALAVGVSTWAVALVIDPHDRAAAVATLAIGAAVALAVFLASSRVLRVAKAAEHAS
jgi:putative peptidoglycan lipid II flippase